jgi:hypothetical protein
VQRGDRETKSALFAATKMERGYEPESGTIPEHASERCEDVIDVHVVTSLSADDYRAAGEC